MAREFLTGDRDQPFLLPPDMRDWLPAEHLVWFVIDVVGMFDLDGFAQRADDPRGRRRYDPRLLVTLVIYAYCVGERSSRRIERRCQEDVAFRVAAANLAPDHTTIARFMKDHADAFAELFAQVLAMAASMGMGKVGAIFIDGTKMAADASPLAAKTREHIEAEVRRITEEARQVDEAEDAEFGDRRGDELPDELVDRDRRLAKLKEALEHVSQQEAADAAKSPSQRRRKSPPRANLTDPQCRVMKGPRSFMPGYNAQAVADETGLVMAADVSTDQADNHLFDPMVDQAVKNMTAAGMAEPTDAVADNGYFTNTNATARPGRPTPTIPPARSPKRAKLKLRGPVPAGATPQQVMERKLATKSGKALYNRRAAAVEPVFGQIKTNRGISRFRRRGHNAARHEWQLITATHNLLKMWRFATAATCTTA